MLPPPGALTALCWHAVDGGSSSALSGRTRLPLIHRAPDMGGCCRSAAHGLEVELQHSLTHPAALHSVLGRLEDLDHRPQACFRRAHIHHPLSSM